MIPLGRSRSSQHPDNLSETVETKASILDRSLVNPVENIEGKKVAVKQEEKSSLRNN